MDMLILLVLTSLLAAAVAAYGRLLFTGAGAGRPPEPFWFAPVVLLIIALLVVFVGNVNVTPFPSVVGQLASALMIAFAGWLWLGWRRG
jgi:hypothetical protein